MKYTNAPGVLIASLACALLLSGCTPTTPTPSPTNTTASSDETSSPPTSEKLTAPKTAEDAIAAAEEKFEEFLAARNAAYQDPTTVSTLEKLSSSGALDRVTSEVSQIAEQEIQIEGDVSFEFMKGAAGTLQTAEGDIEFGSVTITGCVDQTEVVGTLKDGTSATKGDVQRYEISPVVVFDPDRSRWVVFAFEEPKLVVEC